MGLKFLPLVAAALLLAGCACYRLGPVNGEKAGARTVEIVPFENQTMQPRLGDAVTQAVRERFQADGTYRLATGEPGDLVMTGQITRYNRQPLSYLNTDVATPQNYRIGVVAHVMVVDRADNKVVWQSNVTGSTLVNVGTDLQSGERQAMPLLAEDLARRITELTTEGSW
ncbi:MAG TPA: LptE family protein [Verrucomicrobiae bacterium]|nr:LptE family protein [Verrucomicrobiae bacterium]